MNNAVCINKEKAALQELLGGKIEYKTQNWAAGLKTLKCYHRKNCLHLEVAVYLFYFSLPFIFLFM